MNWVCECGIVNLRGDYECGQCGGLRADSWAEHDRASAFAYRVLDVWARERKHGPSGIFYDRVSRLKEGYVLRDAVFASLCHSYGSATNPLKG